MARKYELITELYNQTVKRISGSQGEWRDFLRSACFNYKLTFSEQVLVYAQRPNATAVLELEKWNNQFGRWINRGATGIAVFNDENSDYPLKHYFDISDTHETRFSRPVPLWDIEQRYEDDVIETLESTFGTLENKDDLPTALIYAATNAVEDNFSDYFSELMYCREDSFLEELDELNVEKYFKEALECSVSYMLLERCCGGAADEYRKLVDFSSIMNFNTRETLNALGTATSDIAEMALREIAATVRNLQITEKKQIRTFAQNLKVQYPNNTRQINNSERSFDNGNHIQQERGLQHSQSDSTAGNTGNSPWEIRIETESVSKTEPQGDVHQSSDIGQAERASNGNRTGGNEPTGTDSITDGEVAGRNRTDESHRPNEMGGNDEQHSPFGGGNGVDGTGLQLKLFPTIEEQISNIEKAEDKKSSAFSVSQEDIDSVLLDGSGIEHGKYRIYFHFGELHSKQETTQFLKDEYGWGGSTFYYPDGTKGGHHHDGKGVHIEKHGSYTNPDITLSWDKVAKRIKELIDADRYLSAKEKENIPQYLEYLENAEISRKKDEFINSVADLSPAEKRDTLSVRLTSFLNGLEHYEKSYLEKNHLSELSDTNAEQLDRLLENPLKTKQLIDALASIQGATTGVFARNNAWSFGAELKELHPRKHIYHLGDTVYIGSSEYEVMAYDDETIRLFDTSFSLINKEMSRKEFDRKISENPANDHLLETVIPEQEVTQETAEISEAAETVPETETPFAVGTKLTIDGRSFIIDSIDEEFDKVSLQDITFQSATGFPIFRSESIEFVRDHVESQKDNDNLKEQVTDFLDRAGYAVSEELVDVGIEEYRARGGKGNFEDIGDFIEDNYLSDEPEPDISDITEELPTEKETVTPTPIFAKPKSSSRIQTFDLHPEIPQADRHNFRITDDALGVGSAKEKFRANIAAINTLHDIEFDNRYATPEEQKILSQYVGWGGLSDAFDESKDAWANEFAELYAALSPEEYAAARESSLTAFYTPPIVVKAMYKALENMGYKSGNALEPSCAVGNFMGLVPESMKDCKFYGSEIDSISGRIAQQLYQKNSIAIQGYEKTPLPDSFFDLAIGNVPFGQFKVADKRYDKHNFLIHDYFFARTLDKVRPGGVVAFITSKGTLDKANSKVRKYIAQRADLLGAIRLPDNTFKANAGTEVTSDIIFLQKRDRIVDIEPDWVHLDTDENGIEMNSYFVEHPEMVLGNMEMVSTAYGYDSACKADENSDLAEQLDEAIQNIHAEITEYEFEDLADDEEDKSILADPTVRNFSYTLVDGELYFRENSRMFPVDVTVTGANRIKGMVEIRDCVRTLIEYQTEDYPESDIEAEQAKLNSLYDTFTKKYGLINSRANSTSFSNDSSYCLLCSLEVLDENGELQRKADMFNKRTIKAHSVVTSVDTASEALAVSLAEKACVDIGFMATLMGGSEKAEQIITDLNGVIFRNPAKATDDLYTGWETADEYLSGNIREKLKTAGMYAKNHPEYAVNVQSLETVMPTDLTASEISVRLGATWLPPETVQQFMFELLSTPQYNRWNIKVHYSKFTAQWNIEGKSLDRGNVKAIKAFGTDRINAYKIIEETLNLKDVRIFDTVEDAEGNKKQVLNKKETTIAQQKQEAIKSAFADWIWKEPERRNKLVRMYNDLFNSTRPREYDGSHISFNGINPEITLRPHQKNAVARTMYGGNTLNAHVVGAGKTFTMVAAAQESKRLGLCNKSLFVVPNHLTEQWASDYLQLYPSANILVATKKDFETKNRKKFCGRIATGDYDAVIIGHTQFEKVPMSIERQRAILEGQLDEILDGIAELKSSKAERFTVKQYEKTRKSVQLKLDKLNDQSRKDDVVTFEELGVDRVFIDEAHYYKEL